MDDLAKRLRTVARERLPIATEAAAALEAKDAEIARLREILRDAVTAWDDHNTTGDMMQGWWADDARAALLSNPETPHS